METSKVPVFILAGGLGSRLSEETQTRPKPMVEIGGIPILVHIMRHYYAHGFNDFIICAGYKAWEIKQFFLEYRNRCNHLEIDHRQSRMNEPRPFGKNLAQENWRVRVIDTGAESMTGARIAKAFDELNMSSECENFAVTYGDGLSSHRLSQELSFHLEHRKMGTVLGVKPAARFGELQIDGSGLVTAFLEKPVDQQHTINGGFFFFHKKFRSFLETNEDCILERSPLEKLAQAKELMVFRHDGFWQPMDTLRDRNYLQSLWESGKAPWL